MAVQTYISIDEAYNLYPSTSEYEAEQQASALQVSFSLVNSFLDGTLNVPVVMEDGSIPGILKIVQARFFQWVLESANSGWSQEIQNLFDSTSEMCRKLGANELLISEVSTTGVQLGWNLIDSNLTIGKVFIDGTAPELETTYLFECTTSGTNYVADTEWQVTRSDSATVLYTLAGSYDWQDVDPDGYLQIRFDGQFIGGETFTVKGVPEDVNVVSTNPIIKQSEVYY